MISDFFSGQHALEPSLLNLIVEISTLSIGRTANLLLLFTDKVVLGEVDDLRSAL